MRKGDTWEKESSMEDGLGMEKQGKDHDELVNCWVIEFVAKRKLRVTKYRGTNNNNNHDNDYNQMVTHAAWIMVVQSVKTVLASGK